MTKRNDCFYLSSRRLSLEYRCLLPILLTEGREDIDPYIFRLPGGPPGPPPPPFRSPPPGVRPNFLNPGKKIGVSNILIYIFGEVATLLLIMPVRPFSVI